jgi:hypothetical protein
VRFSGHGEQRGIFPAVYKHVAQKLIGINNYVTKHSLTTQRYEVKLSLCLIKHHVMKTYLSLNYALRHEDVLRKRRYSSMHS